MRKCPLFAFKLGIYGPDRLKGFQMFETNKFRPAIIPCAVLFLAVGTCHALSGSAHLASAAVVSVNDDIKNNVADPPGGPLTQRQLDDLTNQLVQARVLTAEAKARLDRITAILNDKHLDPASDSFATVAEAINDPMVIKLRRQYLEYAGREADWSRRYGADHLAVVNLRKGMGEVREAIFDELRRVAETYRSDYEIAKARAEALSQSLEQMSRSTR
jgi:polysaccharide biosynthesis transport protein